MGFVVKAIKSVVKTVVGVVSKVIGGVFGFLVSGNKSSKKTASVNTLNKTLDPEAYRKAVLGRVAGPLDQRYWEIWGTNGTKFDEVIVVATHQINSFQELYFEDELGIDAAGAVQGKYVGALTRATRLGAPGQTALPVGAGQYDALATFDGCAAMALSWLPDEKKLPNGIPNRYTQVIEGALVYDPRRDSTVPGGSGTHRITDQTTWAYATLDGNGVPIGRNNALQTLWYLLGWRIPTKDAGGVLTGLSELVFGRGVDPTDINLATFIAGANACEAAGYYTDIALSSENTHTANEAKITCDGLIGQLIDPGGLWSYYANVDDTANVAVTLTDQDVIEGVTVSWNPSHGMSDQYTGVVGKYVNPSATTLFQAFPYPMVRDATYEANLGKKVRKTKDFEQVLDSTLAQRLARLFLNQGQYQGEWSSGFNYRALLAQAWSVVRYTSERHQFDLLFRVWRQDISSETGIGMLLKQIDPSIWTAGTVNAALAPAAGTKYDASQLINAAGVAVALTPMAGAGGTLGDGFTISWTAPPTNVRRTEIRYRLVGTVPWLTDGPVAADVLSLAIGPLFSGAIYEAAVRHISIHEVPGAWISPGGGAFALGTTGNVNYAAIAAAGGTANWSTVVNDNGHRPANDADVTLSHISSGFTGQQAIATDADAIARILSMRGDNFARNGDFSEGSTGYLLGPSASYSALGAGYPATYAILFAAGGTSANCYFYPNNQILVGFTARNVFFSAEFYANGISATFTMNINCYDGANNYLGAVSGSITTDTSSIFKPYEVGLQTLAGTAKIIASIQRSATIAVGQYITNLRIAPTQRGSTLGAIASTNLFRSDGVTVLIQAEVRTIEGIASGFTGQGSLSLLNAAAWNSNITGRPVELTDGRVAAGFDASGDLNRNIVTSRLNSSNVMRWTGGALFAGELTADTTLTHISSGFTGQQAIATDADAVPRIISMRGDNYIRNGDFIEGGAGYSLGSSASYFTLGAGYPAPSSIMFAAAGTSANCYANCNSNLSVQYTARTAYFSAEFYANGISATFNLAADCYDGAGAFISTVTGSIVTDTSSVFKVAEVVLALPTNTAKVRPFVQRAATIGVNQFVTNLRFAPTQRGSTLGAVSGTNIFRTGGLIVLTQAEIRTLEGISSGFTGQGALSLLNAVDPSTTQVITRGSIAPSVPDNSFSYTSTTTTVTISWPNLTVYRADGTNIVISSGSQAVTGLTLGTTYKVYPYAVDNGTGSGSMSFVTGGSGSPAVCFAAAGNASAASSMYARGNIPLNSLTVATTSSGSGGGGGGGSTCYHERNLMLTGRGIVEAGQLLVGDVFPSPTGWQVIKELRRKSSGMWVAVKCGDDTDLVVPEHVFYKADKQAIKASELRLGDLLLSNSDHKEVVGLALIYETADRIMTELESPHLYYGGSLQLLSHNPKP